MSYKKSWRANCGMGTTLINSRKRGYDVEQLTDQERTFVLELLGDSMFNPTEAARRAKYKAPGVAANKLMKRPRIQAALGKAQQERELRLQINADRVLEELSRMAFRDVIDLCDENGQINLDRLDQLPEGMRRCIDGLKVNQTRRRITENEDGSVVEEIEQTYELKLVGKLGALELVMKHLGMLQDKRAGGGGGDKTPIDLDGLLNRGDIVDPIEERLAQEEST